MAQRSHALSRCDRWGNENPSCIAAQSEQFAIHPIQKEINQ